MWFDPRPGAPDWSAAVAHLRAADPTMAGVVDRVGPCALAPHGEPFRTLVLSVFNQQISLKGAQTLFARFESRLPGGVVTPGNVLAAMADEATLAGCGLSRQKRSYLLDLATRVDDGRLDLAALPTMDDAGVTAALTRVKGVGVWTAQMYLMFVLCRPDVLPTADLGLREAARRAYGLAGRPDAAALGAMAAPWRPWRTAATWYLWRTKDS